MIYTLGARRAPSVCRATPISPSPPKLHAVAPGGPPEGQCEKENHLPGWMSRIEISERVNSGLLAKPLLITFAQPANESAYFLLARASVMRFHLLYASCKGPDVLVIKVGIIHFYSWARITEESVHTYC